MNVTVAGRHVDITDALRDHVNLGLKKLEGHFDRALNVDVVLEVQKHGARQIAEINLHANGLRVNAKDISDDLYRSFDAALGKIEKQVAKYKDRINRHKPRTARETRRYLHHVIAFGGNGGESESETATATADSLHHVIHHEQLDMRPLSVEEAAFQLDLTDETFVVFLNASTERVNVIYSRGDGTFGLIGPPVEDAV